MLTVASLDHLVLNVRDVEASAAWYARVLGMVREDRTSPTGAPRTSMRFGRMKLNLRPVDVDPRDWFTASHPAAGSEDLCFVSDASPEAVCRHLAACGVEIDTGPVARKGAGGDMISVYCRDPDGNLVEIAKYTDPAT